MTTDSAQGLYPQYASRSGWNAILPPRTPQLHLPAERHVKTIVIGAGYTGLAAARRLAELEPTATVLVLEASRIGEGASARNSGFLSRLLNSPMANQYGSADDAAHRQLAIYAAGHKYLRTLVQRHGIDCDWDDASLRFNAAATPRGQAVLEANQKTYTRLGIDYIPLSRDELAARVGTDYYRFGHGVHHNTFVQPAALIRGLADSLPSNVQIVEQLPVVSIRRGRPCRVETAQATFTCERIVIANNGFAKHLGFLRSRLVTIFTYAGLTPVLPLSEQIKLGQDPAWGIIPAHRLGTTLRKTREGRFMVRSAYSYEKEQQPDTVRHMLEALYRKRYPDMASHHFAHVWGGCTALTRNGGVFFGELDKNVYASVGCNGAGVLRGSIQGKLLAELICHRDSDLLSAQIKLEGPSWMPPEPVRKIGFQTTMLYQHRLAGSEI